MEYRFAPLEYNSLKGTIGEHLARGFIRNHLSSRLIKDEGWHHVILSKNNYKQHVWTWNTKLFNYDNFREDFIVHGFCADIKLLSKYAMVAGILAQNHCTPDGVLLKLRETGRMKKMKESAFPSVVRLREEYRKHRDWLEIPIVNGDLEIVEMKCGRTAKLMDKQKKTYNDLIAKGVPLRMINVRIVSFDLNRFLVEEHKYEKFL